MNIKNQPEQKKTLALDVDGICSDFITGAIELAKRLGRESEVPNCADDVCEWQFFPQNLFDDMDDEFWSNLKPLEYAVEDVTRLAEDYDLQYYITCRPCLTTITSDWLKRNGFPDARVITVPKSSDKLAYLVNHPVDIYVDDLHTTIKDCVSNGVNAVMHPSPYHKGLDKEHDSLPRINKLSDLFIDRKTEETTEASKPADEIPVTKKEPLSPCKEAYRLVHGNRGEDYGRPITDFERTGRLWAVVLQEWAMKTGGTQPIPPHLVSLCMVQLKVSRELNKHKDDNLIDGAGYFETTQMVWDDYKAIQEQLNKQGVKDGNITD